MDSRDESVSESSGPLPPLRGSDISRVLKEYGYYLSDDLLSGENSGATTPVNSQDRYSSWDWDYYSHPISSPKISRNRIRSDSGGIGGCRSTCLSFVVGEKTVPDIQSTSPRDRRSPRFFISPEADDVFPDELEALMGNRQSSRTVLSNPNRVVQSNTTKDTIVPFDLADGEYDYQGIPWSRFSISRPDYRTKRVREYSNYNNVNWNAQLELRRRFEISRIENVSNSYFNFHKTYKSINPTIDHFQLRHLLWSTSSTTSFYVSNSTLYSFNRKSKTSRRVHACNPQQMACCHVDHGLVVSGAFDSEIKVSVNSDDDGNGEWKLVLAKKISLLENSITNHVAIVSPSEIVIGNNDSYVSEVDLVRGGDVCQVFKWSTAVNHVSVSPNEQLLCLSGDSCDVSLIDRRSYSIETNLRGHFDFSFCSSWNGDQLVCTGSQDGTCRVWDIRKPEKSIFCLGSILGAVRCAKFSTDGRWLAFSEPADFVHIYDTTSGMKDCQVIDFFGNISGLAFSPDSSLLSVSVADTMFGCLSDFQVSTLPFNTSKN